MWARPAATETFICFVVIQAPLALLARTAPRHEQWPSGVILCVYHKVAKAHLPLQIRKV